MASVSGRGEGAACSGSPGRSQHGSRALVTPVGLRLYDAQGSCSIVPLEELRQMMQKLSFSRLPYLPECQLLLLPFTCCVFLASCAVISASCLYCCALCIVSSCQGLTHQYWSLLGHASHYPELQSCKETNACPVRLCNESLGFNTVP